MTLIATSKLVRLSIASIRLQRAFRVRAEMLTAFALLISGFGGCINSEPPKPVDERNRGNAKPRVDRAGDGDMATPISEADVVQIVVDELKLTDPSRYEYEVEKTQQGFWVFVDSLPPTPGGHVTVRLSPNGTILEISPGR